MSEEHNNDKQNENANNKITGYYTEGYVKELSIECDDGAALRIEPTPSYMIEDGDVKWVLFVSLKENNKSDDKSNNERKNEPNDEPKDAVLSKLDSSMSYPSRIDALALLHLKQKHLKVRFELDDNCSSINKIIVL